MERLGSQFNEDYFLSLKQFLLSEKQRGPVYPKGSDMLNAFHLTPFEQVRVVILGQDPYHGPGQAHGLAFSVPEGTPPPPSLQNIFKELARSAGLPLPTSGDLTPWARQGVLLLNTVLSVRAHEAASHQGRGWETFTDVAIRSLNDHREGLVFLLWGRHAQAKAALIDPERHRILQAPHPSPLSAHRGFLGSGHFTEVNRLFKARGERPIDWSL